MGENQEDSRVILGEGEVDYDTPVSELAYRTSGGWGRGKRVVRLRRSTAHRLQERGAVLVRDLNAFTEDDLRSIEGVGPMTATVLQQAAREAGVRLADEDSEPSVMVRIKGRPAKDLVALAQEVDLTGSELVTAILDGHRMDELARWARSHVQEVLETRADELHRRARELGPGEEES